MTDRNRRSALIVGATGLVGSELLKYILHQIGYDTVKVLTRKKINLNHSKLEQVIIDFNNLEYYKEHFQVNDVYCCLGTTIKKAGSQEEFKKVDFEFPLEIAKIARANEVEKFLIITAMGADKNSKIFYNKVKGEIEEEIKKLGFPTVQIFRPSLLLGNRKDFRLGEKIATIISPFFSFLLIGSLRKYKPIKAKDVAKAMYHAGQMNTVGYNIYMSDQILTISKNKSV